MTGSKGTKMPIFSSSCCGFRSKYVLSGSRFLIEFTPIIIFISFALTAHHLFRVSKQLNIENIADKTTSMQLKCSIVIRLDLSVDLNLFDWRQVKWFALYVESPLLRVGSGSEGFTRRNASVCQDYYNDG